MRTALLPADDEGSARSTGGVLLLTGDSFMGLAILRSLGRGGVRVVAATALPDGIGRFSRYCDTTVPMPAVGPRLADDVKALCRKHKLTHVVATSEDLIVALNEQRERLEPRVGLLFPPSEIMDVSLHKDRTLAVAKAVGVPAPRTVHPRGVEDLDRCAELGFPLVMKPAHRDPRLGADRVLRFKVEYIKDRETLKERLEAFAVIGEFPLVQEFCPGRGVGIEALCRNGEPLLLFQHRRVHELPPTGGVSVLCESVPVDQELAVHATNLLRAMKWDGVAMVEFRRDDSTGRTMLMEVNGRFWGSLPLAIHAGADFPHMLYRAFANDGPIPAARAYTTGVRCRDLIGDTRRLLTILRTGCLPRGQAIREWIASFRPSTRYYGWSLDDPKPALMGWILRVRKVLGLLPANLTVQCSEHSEARTGPASLAGVSRSTSPQTGT